MNYSEVFKGMASCSEIRDRVITLYRESGGDYHVFMKVDKQKMCDALTKIEDEIEVEKKNQEHRAALKLVRRALENDLDT